METRFLTKCTFWLGWANKTPQEVRKGVTSSSLLKHFKFRTFLSIKNNENRQSVIFQNWCSAFHFDKLSQPIYFNLFHISLGFFFFCIEMSNNKTEGRHYNMQKGTCRQTNKQGLLHLARHHETSPCIIAFLL